MMRFRCGDDVRAAELRGHGTSVEVVVDGVAHAVSLQALRPGEFVLRSQAGLETFHCVRDGARVHLHWRGATYVLEQDDESGRTLQRHHAHGLEAPMPGRVMAVKVEPGQPVARGQEILVVEAMKMENAVRAPRDGVVKAITAKVGDMVAPGVVLVELE